MKEYIKLMRPKHYIKNLLIFIPLIFSSNLFNLSILKNNILGFVCFSLLASIVYIINDINDCESDKKHPIKKNRPISAGKVSKTQAVILAIFLILIIVSIYLLGRINIISSILLVLYLLLNILYSLGLKNIPILDVLILVSGFVIRVIYGSLITNVITSNWLYLTIISFSFYLGFGKRRNEILKNKSNSRKVLMYYNKDFLDKVMYMFLGLFIAFYSLWSISVSSPYMIYTIFWVITISLKYSLDIEGESFGDPVDVLTNDKTLIVLCGLYGLTIFALLYIL